MNTFRYRIHLKSNLIFLFKALICLNGDLIRKDTITHMPPGNAKFLMDSVFGLAIRMNQFGLSDAEIGLFCAVVIITAGKFILFENSERVFIWINFNLLI